MICSKVFYIVCIKYNNKMFYKEIKYVYETVKFLRALLQLKLFFN